jgi:hypothetical protein
MNIQYKKELMKFSQKEFLEIIQETQELLKKTNMNNLINWKQN